MNETSESEQNRCVYNDRLHREAHYYFFKENIIIHQFKLNAIFINPEPNLNLYSCLISQNIKTVRFERGKIDDIAADSISFNKISVLLKERKSS